MSGPAALKVMREARRVSQSRLAKRAGFDNSYISRLEAGSRTPTLAILRRIVDALELAPDDAGRLHVAYGFLPPDTSVLFDAEPEVARLYALLTDDGIPDAVKALVRSNLAITASQLEAWT